MDINARIRRRWRQENRPKLIREYAAISPVAHIDEPADRGLVIERLLDHLDPIFETELPPNAYVYGPAGAGKSAVVTALFTHLKQFSPKARSVIHTSTRVTSATSVRFLYVDRRQIASEFDLYHTLLDNLVNESVPRHGISTNELLLRLQNVIEGTRRGTVVAVDHIDERTPSEAIDFDELVTGPLQNLSWLMIGRTAPAESAFTDQVATCIHVEPYQRQTLTDVLMTRASEGLTQQALNHELAQKIAVWAEGNAHDALAVLCIAADQAQQAGKTRLTSAEITAAIDEVPQPSVSLGQVLALPENKQAVLRTLVDLDPSDRQSVTATTEAISACDAVELAPDTVKRFLYELAETGVVKRVSMESSTGKGRPPSRLELRFPPTAFRRLYDPQE